MIWNSVKEAINVLNGVSSGTNEVDFFQISELPHRVRKLNTELSKVTHRKNDPMILDQLAKWTTQLESIEENILALITATNHSSHPQAKEINEIVSQTNIEIKKAHRALENIAAQIDEAREKTTVNIQTIRIASLSTPEFAQMLRESLGKIKTRIQQISAHIAPNTHELLLQAKIIQHKYLNLYRNYSLYQYAARYVQSNPNEKMSLVRATAFAENGEQFSKITEEIDQLLRKMFIKSGQPAAYVNATETIEITNPRAQQTTETAVDNQADRALYEAAGRYVQQVAIESRARRLKEQTTAFQQQINEIISTINQALMKVNQTPYSMPTHKKVMDEIQQSQILLQQGYDALKLLNKNLERKFPQLILDAETKQSIEGALFQVECAHEQIKKRIDGIPGPHIQKCKDSQKAFGELLIEDKKQAHEEHHQDRSGYSAL